MMSTRQVQRVILNRNLENKAELKGIEVGEEEREKIRKLENQPMRSNIQLQELLKVREKKIRGRK